MEKTILFFTLFILITTSLSFGQTEFENKTPAVISDSPSFAFFPGGEECLNIFLSENLKWVRPDICISGRVILSFEVDANGEISEVKIEKGIHEDFDNEAIRVVKLMPNWIPAKRNGHPISSKVFFPVKFTILE